MGELRVICYTTVGQPFMIDALDLPIIREFSCIRLNSKGYVEVKRPGEKQRFLLHRLIMLAPDGVLVDHRDLNRTNNMRDNLRLATHQQNNCNTGKSNRDDHSSEFKGVSFRPDRERWRARIYHNKKCIWLGDFSCPVEAAEAYDQAAMEKHGPFAKLNFTYPTFQEEMDRAR